MTTSVNLQNLFAIKNQAGNKIAGSLWEKTFPLQVTNSALLQAGLVNFVELGKGTIRLIKRQRTFAQDYTDDNKNEDAGNPVIADKYIYLNDFSKTGTEMDLNDNQLWTQTGQIHSQTVADTAVALDNRRDILLYKTILSDLKSSSYTDAQRSSMQIVKDISAFATENNAVAHVGDVMTVISEIQNTVDDFYKGIYSEKIKAVVSHKFKTWYRVLCAANGRNPEYFIDPVTGVKSGNLSIDGVELIVDSFLGKIVDKNGRTKTTATANDIDLTNVHAIITTTEAMGVEQGYRTILETINYRNGNPNVIGRNVAGAWMWKLLALSQVRLIVSEEITA